MGVPKITPEYGSKDSPTGSSGVMVAAVASPPEYVGALFRISNPTVYRAGFMLYTTLDGGLVASAPASEPPP